MTTYNFVSFKPTSQSFELVTNTRSFQSPVSGAIQTLARKGSYWKTQLTFTNVSGAERAELQALFARLNGQEHRVRLEDYGYVRRGNAVGPQTVLVNGAGQTGSTINLDGATFSVTGYFKQGDYISFNNELHMVTEDVDSSATGTLSVPIAPPIRKPTNDGDSVRIFDPFGVFMLSNDVSWRTSSTNISSLSVSFMEDILA